ncbi:MAG TPA: glycosyltransferase family 2 protein [Myxococcota bacterium]|nr:glycosyltransferase family 2 protein [Myxococcota bacterium]HNH46382.1 glycosyltransferase family 2 protein [Myxococcota bacterium]
MWMGGSSRQRRVVVLPAYNAARTLEESLRRLPTIAQVLLVDDASSDGTAALARSLGLSVRVHEKNGGYGANQKSCYRWAIEQGAEQILMLHPDLQYPPEQVPALFELLDQHDIAMGSRFLGGDPRSGGMPDYKYWSNRALSHFQNRLLHARLSEYHCGFRAYRVEALQKLPWQDYPDDFLFDNQLLIDALRLGLSIGELPIPTHYGPESSSISARKAVIYGLGVVAGTLRARFRPS